MKLLWWKFCESIVHKLFHKLWWNCCDESFVKVLFINCDEIVVMNVVMNVVLIIEQNFIMRYCIIHNIVKYIDRLSNNLWWRIVEVCDEVVMKLWKYVVKIWWSICHSIVVIKVVIKNCLMICWNNLSPICCESFVTKMWQDVLNVCVKMCWNVDDEIILLNCFCD